VIGAPVARSAVGAPVGSNADVSGGWMVLDISRFPVLTRIVRNSWRLSFGQGVEPTAPTPSVIVHDAAPLVDYGTMAYADRGLGFEDWVDDILPEPLARCRAGMAVVPRTCSAGVSVAPSRC